MVKEALRLAKLGFAVFPLAPNTKMPTRGSAGVKDATTDTEKIKKLFERNPNSKPFNIGIALGTISGIVAVDLDRNHGATDEDLARLPRTVTVKTRNGFHVYSKINRPCKKGALWGGKNEGDNTAPAYLRTDGQYVVGPGSIVTWDETAQQHLAPHEYSYHGDAGGELSFEDCAIAELPDEWYRDGSVGRSTLCDPRTASESKLARPQDAERPVTGTSAAPNQAERLLAYEPGLRHDCLLRTAVSMRKRGKQIDDIRRALHERNQTSFTIPKENAEKEIASLCSWVEKNVRPLVVFTLNEITGEDKQYIKPLGHRDDNYYYTTSDNKMIIKLGRASHTMGNLLDLMPLLYWTECYPKPGKDGKPDGVNWALAASELMEACRFVGIYSDQNVRGVGCWQDQGKLVYHTGSELIVDGQPKSLNGIEGTNYLYTLRPSVATTSGVSGDRPLSVAECSALLDACQALTWQNPQSAKLLAGGLAIARLCGALSWRPHIWLTSPKGCGKSAIMSYLVRPVLGKRSSLYIQGETTSAGIRQRLESDSKPVIFDESETNNERSNKRMQHIIELARQSSFENDGEILKGTADGSGHSYKITSMFLLASTRVNLVEDADISRFTVMHLAKPDGAKWPSVRKKLTTITYEYGDRLAVRMMAHWATFQKNCELMENAVADRYDRRDGQQYAPLLAGWWALTSDALLSVEQAASLANELDLSHSKTETDSGEERDCIDWLLQSQVRYDLGGEPVMETFGRLINKATADAALVDLLPRYGLDHYKGDLFLSTQNPHLQSVYRDTKWGQLFHQALARLDGARRTKHRFNRIELRCVAIPVTTIFPA